MIKELMIKSHGVFLKGIVNLNMGTITIQKTVNMRTWYMDCAPSFQVGEKSLSLLVRSICRLMGKFGRSRMAHNHEIISSNLI